jgi:hypothetical protein
MARIVRRVLGMGFDGKPIYAPKHAHSLLLAAAGGGKTTCGAVPLCFLRPAEPLRAERDANTGVPFRKNSPKSATTDDGPEKAGMR